MDPKTFKPRPFRPESLPPPRHSLPEDLAREGFYLEIGSGTGLHAINFALGHPDAKIVAIERTGDKSRKAANRLSRLSGGHPPNLHLIRDDAINWVAHRVRGPWIKGVFILYPNPYPKESQANKRFHYMPFMTHLVRCLREGALLTVCSNEPTYFLEAREVLPRVHGLRLDSERVCDPRQAARTQFEWVFFEKGLLCYEATFAKVEGSHGGEYFPS